jgi:protein TonB
MSALRTLSFGLLGAVIVTSGLAAQQPLDSIGPIERQSNPITPENPIPRRSYSVAPVYPSEARGIEASATVMLVATISDTGRVVEIRRALNPTVMSPSVPAPTTTALQIAADGFVREAASALRQWTYDPPAKGPLTFTVAFSFKPGADTVSSQVASVAPPPLPGQSTAATLIATANQPIRVGGTIKAPTLVKKVEPVYPLIAQSARVQGVVILEATIGADGRVVDAKILRSIPLLDAAALNAVRQWEYTPTLMNGVPVPIIMTATVTFTLPAPPQAAAQ